MKAISKRLLVMGLLVTAMLVIAACGGGNNNDNDGGTTPPPQEQTTQNQTTTPDTTTTTTETEITGDVVHVDGLPVGMDPASLELPRLERPERFTFRDQNSFPAHWNSHAQMNTNIQITMHRDFLSLRFAKIYSPDNGQTFDLMNVAATNHTDITSTFSEEELERFGLPYDVTSGHVFTIDIRQDLRWNDGSPINAHCWERSMQLLLSPEMMNHGGAGWSQTFAGGEAYRTGEGEWEDVGVWASGDYQLTFVLNNWSNMFDFRNGIHGEWLVHEETYVAGKSWEEDLLVTNYNTTVETSMFAGPFMVTNAELDRQLVFERNPYWFGWNDPAFDNFYMMTDIIIDVIPEPATRLMLFNQGLLDRISVTADDFGNFRFSDRLVQWSTTNNSRLVFNTDLDMLRALEQDMGDGYNRQVLALDDFRRGLSFAIDRFQYALQTTAGGVPTVVLMDNYFYDFSNNPDSHFRRNEHAMRAFVEFYEVEYGPGTPFPTLFDAFDSITGFNVHRSRELLQSAYEQAIELGIYTSGQPINIHFVASAAALTPFQHRQNDLLREMFAYAAVGTGFEGMIDVTFLGNFPAGHDALIEGRVEARTAGWGGAMFSPVGLMAVYVNTVSMGGLNNINESAGWDPSVATFDLTFDWHETGEETTRTKTFEDWHMSISGTGEFVDDIHMNTRLFILANLEVQVINTFQNIPLLVGGGHVLVSHKIDFNPGYYHPMFDDLPGPRSQISFNFTDDAWADFVAAAGGTLNYE